LPLTTMPASPRTGPLQLAEGGGPSSERFASSRIGVVGKLGGGGEGLALLEGEVLALGERLELGLALLLGEIDRDSDALGLELSEAEGETEPLGLIDGEPTIATPPPKSSAIVRACSSGSICNCNPICPAAL